MSVYNDENPMYLNESLKSIKNQTVMAKEVVIVEDGPISLALQAVINKYVDTLNCKVVKLKSNGGLGDALRIGTNYVTTNLIARMDSDDICVKNRFELELNEFSNDSSLDVLGGQILEFNDDIKNIIGYRYVPTSNDKILKFFKFRNPMNHPTVMIKKSSLLNVGGYENFYHLEDYYLWGKFLLNGDKMKNISQNLLYMRIDKGTYYRRGGIKYFLNYCKLKKAFKAWGLINMKEMFIGNSIMLMNTLIPCSLRQYIYLKILHKLRRG